MADDIVKRLGCALVSHGSAEQSCGECAYCLAAAEIVRLRAVLDAVDALACSVDRPDDAVDYWVTGYANAMQKVKALLHPESGPINH